jgi:ABC-type spermidine/putrescine transport system permease subunit I
VLVSFWTYKLGAKSGFTTDWTLSNYGTIVHSSTYWHNMLTSVYTSLIAVVAWAVLLHLHPWLFSVAPVAM